MTLEKTYWFSSKIKIVQLVLKPSPNTICVNVRERHVRVKLQGAENVKVD